MREENTKTTLYFPRPINVVTTAWQGKTRNLWNNV